MRIRHTVTALTFALATAGIAQAAPVAVVNGTAIQQNELDSAVSAIVRSGGGRIKDTPELRNEASTLSALIRGLGGAAGISVIQTMTIRFTAANQSRLVEQVRPDNPVVGWRAPDFEMFDPASVAAMLGQVSRQAAMVAYVESFTMILALAVVSAPLCLLLRVKRGGGDAGAPASVVHVD